MTHTSSTAPIAIVGGGPVGLMLALFLDRHGVTSVLFNDEDTVRWHPKGSTHNARTMEHYRRLGLSAQVRQLGLPPDHPTDVAYFTRLNGWELARLRMPSHDEKMRTVAAAAATDQVPEPIHRANQMYVEALLLEQARRRPNITLRYGWSVRDFADDGSGVSLHAQCGAEAEAWRCQYLVGCDGGHSFVRRQLGIRYQGHHALDQPFFGGRMLSTHLRAPAVSQGFAGPRRAWQYWVVNPELRTALFALNGTDEFLLLSKVADADRPPDDDAVARIVQLCAGADIPVEILGHRPWSAGIALVAERFAAGRILLAGDAVHLFTPTGGFGMNTGIDDAANLSWKLAAMIQGWGGPDLLDSYAAERMPIAARNTAAARALALNIGDVQVAAAMEQASPAGDTARREVGAFLAGFGEEFASIGVQLGARYDGSPIIASDAPPPPDSYVQYTPSSIPGGRAPHVWLDRGRGFGSSLFDRFGVGFTLLRLGPYAADGTDIQAAAQARGVPLAILDVADPAARDLYGCDLALVRPDQHIAWRGTSPPADAGRVLAKVVGEP